MKEEWKAMSFETLPHKDTGTYLLKGIDDVQTLLDDHIVKTQAIRGSFAINDGRSLVPLIG